MSLKINKVDTSKDDIYQRALMLNGIIPGHPGVTIMSGSQGGGKSTLVANLLSNPIMYGKSYEGMEEELKKNPSLQPKPYFDAIFLMLGSDDDMFDFLVKNGTIKENHVCHMPKPDDIQKVIDGQRLIIEKSNKNMKLVPKILFIFDDVINDGALMRSKPFLELFVKGRHLNSSTFLLSQYLNLVTRSCRMQNNWLFQFKSNRAEIQTLCDQFCPPSCTKQEFSKMIQETTKDTKDSKNNFLTIVKRAPEDKRFRRNLDEFVTLKRLNYVPKLDKIPNKKELEDIDFDQDNTIKDIHEDYVLNDVMNRHYTFLDPVLDKLIENVTEETKKKPKPKIFYRKGMGARGRPKKK